MRERFHRDIKKLALNQTTQNEVHEQKYLSLDLSTSDGTALRLTQLRVSLQIFDVKTDWC